MLSGYAEGSSETMPDYRHSDDLGFYRLLFEDFQSLDTDAMQRSAVPWKVLGAGLVRVRQAEDPSLPTTEAAMVGLMSQRFGFVVPERVANWPAGSPQPVFERPAGIVSGTVSRSLPEVAFEVANTGCTTCHSANLYDAEGNPTRALWVGLPSSSINMERYARDAYAAMKWAARNPRETLQTIEVMFPGTSATEIKSIRKYYLPQLKKRIGKLERTIDNFTPYSNGSPGIVNGAATIQLYLGVIGVDRWHGEQVAFASVPDLGGLRWRRSILSDGVYAPRGWEHFGPLGAEAQGEAHRNGMAGVVGLVTLGTLGVRPEVAVSNRGRMRDIIDFVFDRYQPPPFPGPVDRELARTGHGVFERACSSCHGTYEETERGWRLASFPNQLVEQAYMGTDATRWQMVSDYLQERFRKTALAKIIDLRRGGGYVALPLTGLWATAPYLHNGSVPTLWHLMHPEERPARFQVGGHRLDWTRMGIDGEGDASGVYAYPAGYAPWSLPEVYDTTSPGRGNGGHVRPFQGVSEEEKRQLLEFLKLV
jgi:mono/diheme cytochrome c family protein